MNNTYLFKCLKEMEDDGYGEILERTKEGIAFYDYESDETFYRNTKSCTLKWLSSIMYIGEIAKKRGLKENDIAKVIKIAYGDSFFDAVCTLSGIIIYSNEKEFYIGMKQFCDEEEYFLEYEDMEDKIGLMWHMKKVLIINENEIYRVSLELSNLYEEDFIESYSRGIYETILHELRHCMLDTNYCLSEEDYPIEESYEDNVEEFCRDAYYKIPYKFRIINIPKESISA